MSAHRRPQSRRRLLPRFSWRTLFLGGGGCIICCWSWFLLHNHGMFYDANDMDNNNAPSPSPPPMVVSLSTFLQELNRTQGRVCGKQKCFFASSTNSTTGYLLQDTSTNAKNIQAKWDMAYRLDQQWKRQYDSYKSYYLPHHPPFVVHVDSGTYLETLNTQFRLVKTNKGGPPMMFSLSNDKLLVQPVQKAAATSTTLLLGCSRTKYKPALKQIPDYCQRLRNGNQPMQYQTLLDDWKWIRTTIMDATPQKNPALWLLNHDFQVILENGLRLVHLDIDRVFELVPPHLRPELLNHNNRTIAWETLAGVPQRPKIQACRANMQTLIDRIGKECFSL